MRAAVVIPLLALASGASSQGLEPPARYDYEPPGGVRVLRLGAAEGDLRCRAAGRAPYGAQGCMLRRRPCVIVITARASDAALIYRHERAHCNGWR